jgi:hypothetical protein
MFVDIAIPVVNDLAGVAEERKYVMIELDEVFIIVLACFLFCILLYFLSN